MVRLVVAPFTLDQAFFLFKASCTLRHCRTAAALGSYLALTGGGSDITDIMESYSEFAIDAKVDAKSFELPK